MTFVGASAEPLEQLALACTGLSTEARASAARIGALLREADDCSSAPATLAHMSEWADSAAAQAQRAAGVAAADAEVCAPAPHQTGVRASMGLVDDVLLDVFFVNDISRLVRGVDVNTGLGVSHGDRVLSGAALTPFGKLAKGLKLLRFGDDAAEGTRAATAAARSSVVVRSADDAREVLAGLAPGRQGHVRTVTSVAELDDLFETLASGGRAQAPGTYAGQVRVLSDGTRIGRRNVSGAGGPTIDISGPSIRTMKVHISPWPPN